MAINSFRLFKIQYTATELTGKGEEIVGSDTVENALAIFRDFVSAIALTNVEVTKVLDEGDRVIVNDETP
jgi:predicted KAP-like P-loop ATPase